MLDSVTQLQFYLLEKIDLDLHLENLRGFNNTHHWEKAKKGQQTISKKGFKMKSIDIIYERTLRFSGYISLHPSTSWIDGCTNVWCQQRAGGNVKKRNYMDVCAYRKWVIGQPSLIMERAGCKQQAHLRRKNKLQAGRSSSPINNNQCIWKSIINFHAACSLPFKAPCGDKSVKLPQEANVQQDSGGSQTKLPGTGPESATW